MIQMHPNAAYWVGFTMLYSLLDGTEFDLRSPFWPKNRAQFCPITERIARCRGGGIATADRTRDVPALSDSDFHQRWISLIIMEDSLHQCVPMEMAQTLGHLASHINLAHSSDVWPSWSYSYYRYMLGEKHISWLRVPCWQLLVLQEASTTSWGGTACISVLDDSNIRVISSAEEGNCDQLCIFILYAEFCWLCHIIPLKLPHSLQPAAVWIAIRTPKLNRHLSTCTHSCLNEYVTEVSSLYSRFAVNPSPVQIPPKPMYIYSSSFGFVWK